MNNSTTYFKGGQKFNSDGALVLTFRATPRQHAKKDIDANCNTNKAHRTINVQSQRDRLESEFNKVLQSDKREVRATNQRENRRALRK